MSKCKCCGTEECFMCLYNEDLCVKCKLCPVCCDCTGGPLQVECTCYELHPGLGGTAHQMGCAFYGRRKTDESGGRK